MVVSAPLSWLHGVALSGRGVYVLNAPYLLAMFARALGAGQGAVRARHQGLHGLGGGSGNWASRYCCQPEQPGTGRAMHRQGKRTWQGCGDEQPFANAGMKLTALMFCHAETTQG